MANIAGRLGLCALDASSGDFFAPETAAGPSPTLTASPGARAHYDRRDHGDRHGAAQRNLFNRLLGCLHHCLATGQHYDEATAFPNQPEAANKEAA